MDISWFEDLVLYDLSAKGCYNIFGNLKFAFWFCLSFELVQRVEKSVFKAENSCIPILGVIHVSPYSFEPSKVCFL